MKIAKWSLPTRYYPRAQTNNGLLSTLKLVISIPDHSLSAKYREWSGIINLEGSNGCRYGDA